MSGINNMNQREQHFASDNYSGICPEAMEYLTKVNLNHDLPYGEDKWTARAANKFREIFETDCEVFFVFNGTAANSLALSASCSSYHSVICHEVGHVETDECGAPEFFSNGAKLLLAEGENGKLTPEAIRKIVLKRNDIHYPKPKVVSLTQATEVGTVYSEAELKAISEVAKEFKMHIHMDGARFANAAATLGIAPKVITWESGVDVLCFGGIKNGLAVGDAIVFFDKELAFEFDYRCKQAGQLSSKMRFLSAPWLGLLENDVWLKNARHANSMARYLENKLKEIPGIELMFPREANSVFVKMTEEMINHLRQEKNWRFYTFIGEGGVRLMCTWDTRKEVVDEFTADIRNFSLQEKVK